ncbi:hypothetical protein M0813_07482 [Anaeramoeba flamelloides]|uniref:Uncharacterized protein n=1 Tax=Anaeramoeba flamelloides TaxID=1746091 RepID=A0ABQ8XCW9_9EUKA|nr:hypothetical protein M0813_07482 [Anaeramoeba flamelloides]
MENIHLLCAGKSWNFSLIGQGYLKYKDNKQLKVSPTDSYRISLPPFSKENLIQLFKESFISFNNQNTDIGNNDNKNVTYYQYMFGFNKLEKLKEEKKTENENENENENEKEKEMEMEMEMEMEKEKENEKEIEKVDVEIINYFFEQVLVKTGGTPRMLELIRFHLLKKYDGGEKYPLFKNKEIINQFLKDVFRQIISIKEVEDMENSTVMGKKFKIIVPGYLIEYLRDEPRFEIGYQSLKITEHRHAE